MVWRAVIQERLQHTEQPGPQPIPSSLLPVYLHKVLRLSQGTINRVTPVDPVSCSEAEVNI